MAVLWTLFGALLVYALLSLIYKILRLRWPTVYVSLSDTFGLRISQSLPRVLAFRIVPVVVVTWAVGVTTERLGGFNAFAIAAGVLAHLITTNLKAIFLSLRGQERVNYTSYHLAVVALVAVATLIGYTLTVIAPELVPGPEVFLEDLWLALLISIVGGGFLLLVGGLQAEQNSFGPHYFQERAVRDVGMEAFDFAFREAILLGRDPFLVRALLIVEILQRPRWLRNVESWTWWMRREGTYGVMQMRSRRPVSDYASISAGVHGVTTELGIRYSGDYRVFEVDRHVIWAAAAAFNGDKVHIDSVTNVYEHLTGYGVGLSHVSRGTNRSAIFECRRYGQECGLRGATVAMSISVLSSERDVLAEFSRDLTDDSLIHFFELRIPISHQSVIIRETDAIGVNSEYGFEIPLQD